MFMFINTSHEYIYIYIKASHIYVGETILMSWIYNIFVGFPQRKYCFFTILKKAFY